MALKRTPSGTEKPADAPPSSPADPSGDSFSGSVTSAAPPEFAGASGSQFVTGGDFPTTLEEGGLIVDKSLLCKALLDSGKEAMRICLPRGFGKSFGLSVIAAFFNVVTIHDVTGGAGADGLDAAKARRKKMFHGSLLKTSYPVFFDEHFAKYPVIRIDFKEAAVTSLGAFYKSVARALLLAAGYWVRAYNRADLRTRAQSKYDDLCEEHGYLENKLRLAADQWEGHGLAASMMFGTLSRFLNAQHDSDYIVLFDEYDTPLEGIFGTTWYSAAHVEYLSLMSQIFKGNGNLEVGLLVGVNEFMLFDGDSGANNVARVELTAGRFRSPPAPDVHRPSDYGTHQIAGLFGFTAEEVKLLLLQARKSSSHVRDYSPEVTMATIAEWYGGYDFGFNGKRYHPVAVMRFLQSLADARGTPTGSPFWLETGNAECIEKLVSTHSANILLLATRLFRDFDADGQHCSLRAVGLHYKNWAAPWDNSTIDISLGGSTYSDKTGEIRGLSGLATILLHLGYLTFGAGNTLRIPNQEIRSMWERLCHLSVFGTAEPGEVIMLQQRLVDQLYRGQVDGLLGIRDIMATLSDFVKKYMEKLQAGAVGAYIVTKLTGTGRNAQGGPDTDAYQPDFAAERESGEGKVDLAVTFRSGGNHPEGLVVLVKYKHVEEKDKWKSDALLVAARNGLEQLVDKGYAAPYSNYARRLDIGIGIYGGRVMLRQRLWVRDDTGSPGEVAERTPPEHARRTGEDAATWDCRIMEADDDGWRDAHGWRTDRLDAAFRSLEWPS
ncbi:hypothetical protein H4R19_001077 [Coemansia spiralis]|nr:hypothetical protein H4R19_001077 [Coemansia spiralis]